jgi:GT2 family glycosyltransferase
MTVRQSGPAVIIPTKCGVHRLPAVLDSLRTQTVDHQVVVVDNGSTDGTAELAREQYPEVFVVSLERNMGFGAAVNRGVTKCAAATIALVNDDAVCAPDFVEALCEPLDPERGTVMSAGVLLDGNDPTRIDSAGVMFDSTLLAFDYLHGRKAAQLSGRTPAPLGPTGGAAAFDRSAFEAVGGFDERYFAYLEDVDLAARILSHGGRCAFSPDARAVHRHSSTLGSGTREKARLMGWSRGYTMAKYRMHRRPASFVRAALAELALASGQVLYDRTTVGLRARANGFRVGLHTAAHVVEALPDEAHRLSVRYVLAERLRAGKRRRSAFRATEPTSFVPIPR